MFLEPIHGALDEGLAGLACSIIHIRDWTRMRIRRHSWGAFYDDIVEVNAEGQVTWHDDSLRRRSLTDFRTSALPLLAELYIWIYELECADEDSYKCEVDREEEESMAGGHLLKVYGESISTHSEYCKSLKRSSHLPCFLVFVVFFFLLGNAMQRTMHITVNNNG